MPRLIASVLLASAALLLEAPRLSAQASIPAAAPATPAVGATPAIVPTERAVPPSLDPASLSLKLEAGKLGAAVEQLQASLDAAHKPGVNVLYGPGVQDLEIPQLTLRKVSGTDALRLIAVSAGCKVEVIVGDRNDAIGYQIVAPNQPGGAAVYGIGGMPANPRQIWKTDRTTSQPEKAPPTAAVTPSTRPGRQPNEYALAVNAPVASNAVIGFTSPAQAGPTVRVYSLGEITTTVKFADVVQTLEDLLKASGISLESAKLAVHEKTNVIVVSGDLRVQELVGELLEALQRNTAVASAQRSRDDSSRRDMIEMEVRLNAERDQSNRLKQQLDQSEAQLTKLQRELDRVSHAAPPSPK
jgi:hypothetical protein